MAKIKSYTSLSGYKTTYYNENWDKVGTSYTSLSGGRTIHYDAEGNEVARSYHNSAGGTTTHYAQKSDEPPQPLVTLAPDVSRTLKILKWLAIAIGFCLFVSVYALPSGIIEAFTWNISVAFILFVVQIIIFVVALNRYNKQP